MVFGFEQGMVRECYERRPRKRGGDSMDGDWGGGKRNVD